MLPAHPRWVNSAVTRPFKLRIVDEHGEDVSSSACLVVAGEGGVRREPAPFPPGGLFIGVAERYEVRWARIWQEAGFHEAGRNLGEVVGITHVCQCGAAPVRGHLCVGEDARCAVPQMRAVLGYYLVGFT